MSVGLWLFFLIVVGGALLFGIVSRIGMPAPGLPIRPPAPTPPGSGVPLASVPPPVKAAAPTPTPAKPVPAAVVSADEPVPDTYKPTLLSAPQGGKGDDLELIWGVGPKLAELLNRLGVYHFSQIASWSDENLRWIDQNLEAFKGRASRDKWIEQSKKLASGWRPDSKIGDRPTT